jgi:2-polyprenyl-6-methoxyphenol hydroxylase-like FAD-dependent oxidoreductase
MARDGYDLITVGGGLAGSVLAKTMAEAGARVLVLERETQFKDRVRGEGMMPWGVVEARALGIDAGLRVTGGHDLFTWNVHVGPTPGPSRDLVTTTAAGTPALSFYHPDMQEVLLDAAARAGAEVRRGVTVSGVAPGTPPTVWLDGNGRREEIQARLVIGADGRASRVRSWAGFEVKHDPQRLLIAGVLLDGTAVPDDGVHLIQGIGELTIPFPLGNGRARVYVAHHNGLDRKRFQGEADLPRFIEESVRIGAPSEWYNGATIAGPLATFDGADTWVPHPYKDGVALVGDAAASTDPSWGQGLSLTLRDVRVLRDQLSATDDWSEAGQAYARAHDQYYGVLHTAEDWFTQLFMEIGPQADARRARALPLIAEDPSRVPDILLDGPGLSVDDDLRSRFFGEQ